MEITQGEAILIARLRAITAFDNVTIKQHDNKLGELLIIWTTVAKEVVETQKV